MNHLGDLQERQCPVCGGTTNKATLFLDRSIDVARITGASFASRKEPEYMSYRLMRCSTCSTIYAAEAPRLDLLATIYRDAEYDTAIEAEFAATTYASALQPALARLKQRGTLLEIGTGTGIFLGRLAKEGFEKRIGIEPSRAAIDAAGASVRPLIREGIFDPADFTSGSISMICCFQTLEHVADPRSLADAAFRLLEPGGLLALITHDVTAPINRLLGRRSPIIDIEHLQLFCPESLRYLLASAGFNYVNITPIKNTYPLRYWLRLAPLPLKCQILHAVGSLGLAELSVSANVGNILTVAWKQTA